MNDRASLTSAMERRRWLGIADNRLQQRVESGIGLQSFVQDLDLFGIVGLGKGAAEINLRGFARLSRICLATNAALSYASLCAAAPGATRRGSENMATSAKTMPLMASTSFVFSRIRAMEIPPCGELAESYQPAA